VYRRLPPSLLPHPSSFLFRGMDVGWLLRFLRRNFYIKIYLKIRERELMIKKQSHFLIQAFSDIQIYSRLPRIPVKSKYLFLAGNICDIDHPLFFRFLDTCSQNWEKTFYVPGNREYHSKTKTVLELDFEYNKQIYNRYKNVYFLNNRFVPLNNDINVYGSISWYIPHYPTSTYPTKTLDAIHINQLAEDSMKNMKSYIDHTNKSTIMMTHFSPVRSKTHLFYSDINNRLERINTDNIPLWISAHPHWNYDFKHTYTRLLVNLYHEDTSAGLVLCKTPNTTREPATHGTDSDENRE
jgi:hypothetical protein